LNGVAIGLGGALASGGFPGLEWIAEAAEEPFAQDNRVTTRPR